MIVLLNLFFILMYIILGGLIISILYYFYKHIILIFLGILLFTFILYFKVDLETLKELFFSLKTIVSGFLVLIGTILTGNLIDCINFEEDINKQINRTTLFKVSQTLWWGRKIVLLMSTSVLAVFLGITTKDFLLYLLYSYIMIKVLNILSLYLDDKFVYFQNKYMIKTICAIIYSSIGLFIFTLISCSIIICLYLFHFIDISHLTPLNNLKVILILGIVLMTYHSLEFPINRLNHIYLSIVNHILLKFISELNFCISYVERNIIKETYLNIRFLVGIICIFFSILILL